METNRKSTKRLNTARDLTKVVAEYYLECHQAKASGKPVGWMPPMNGAIEVFYAMDLQPVFPENWSPVCAAFGLTPEQLRYLRAHGLFGRSVRLSAQYRGLCAW